MDIIPAIDLRESRCVRLYKGDFSQQTIYAQDPIAIAERFARQGAKFVHIVDLDGAKNEQMAQTDIIKKIAGKTYLQIQTGGGIRDANKISELLNAGIKKVVLGSMAIKNPEQVQSWLRKFGQEKIVLAFDVKIINKIPRPAIFGWQQQSQISLWDVLDSYKVKYILCTDIEQDGTLNGPNLSLYQEISERYPDVHIQASGGITSIADVKALKKSNVQAAIIGKAFYENKLSLPEVLQC